MLALLTIFAGSFLAALSGALMPGPLLTAAIGESSRRGFWAGPLLMVGHGILELGMVLALLLGLSPFLRREGVFAVVALAGGVILLWMAYGMLRSLPRLSLTFESVPSSGRGRLVVSGALVSLANPYWLVWWATFGVTCILKSIEWGLVGVACFYAGHILADVAWYSMVTAAVSRGRHLLSNRLYRGLIGTCAAFLVVFAIYFIQAAVRVMMKG